MFFNQQIKSFKIIEAMNKFKQAFKLKLLSIIEIYLITFIAQLNLIILLLDLND